MALVDWLIRGAQICDGTGTPPRVGDLAIEAGRIVSVGGRHAGSARRTLDADGAVVMPGIVDLHTHYDAQVLWDPAVTPSNEHGVTTVVVGNCGLGLAPVRAEDRGVLAALLGGVEDIPRESLAAALDWRWEDHPSYLDRIAELPRSVDVGAFVGHAALRLFALGAERAYADTATPSEIGVMREALEAALDAGALGFSTSRSRTDRDDRGRPTPCCFAEDAETHALADVLASRGEGLLELSFRGSAGDEPERLDEEVAWMRDLAARTGRPVSFGLAQLDAAPDAWRRVYAAAGSAAAEGVMLRPQTLGRMQSVLLGLDAVHPFQYRPGYRAITSLPVAERAARMRDPSLRRRILDEVAEPAPPEDPFASLFRFEGERIFPLEDPPDYEPGPGKSLAAEAHLRGVSVLEVLYDRLVEGDGGTILLYAVANYHEGDLSATREMLAHPCSLLGLGDGGAHVGLLCDASVPTFLLAHWTRDRSRGPGFPLEWMVHRLTDEPARLLGLHDRGRLAPGLRADLNVFDPALLSLERPRLVRDLPAGAKRFVQGARGWLATFVGGEPTRLRGEETEARPGGLARALRSQRSA
ncbi:MAG: amidohydrolase family protein [Spirochaetaceae bacterium]|nr:amidohydrolase family protein [Myxococcales bacterium]MCB9723100.1 amidohydrolase family protein [Spirochaetaceae bacterium]